jgi:hypothetical protein
MRLPTHAGIFRNLAARVDITARSDVRWAESTGYTRDDTSDSHTTSRALRFIKKRQREQNKCINRI